MTSRSPHTSYSPPLAGLISRSKHLNESRKPLLQHQNFGKWVCEAVNSEGLPYFLSFFLSFLLVALRPIFGLWPQLSRLRDHPQTRHTRYDSSGRVTSPSQDLYLTLHNTHERQISTPAVVFEPTFPASDGPQTYALDQTATGIGKCLS